MKPLLLIALSLGMGAVGWGQCHVELRKGVNVITSVGPKGCVWRPDFCIGPAPDCPDTPKPEPVDVPAIKHTDTRMFYCGQGGPRCDHGEHFDPPNGPTTICMNDPKLEASCGKTFFYTCKDKSRILLTDESGGKHCIKFPKEEGTP